MCCDSEMHLACLLRMACVRYLIARDFEVNCIFFFLQGLLHWLLDTCWLMLVDDPRAGLGATAPAPSRLRDTHDLAQIEVGSP